MKHAPMLALAFCCLIAGSSRAILGQATDAKTVPVTAESTLREQDGLIGPVRRVRTETTQLVLKDGKLVEGPRVLRGLTTYDQRGGKIDSVDYPVSGGSPVGKEQYRYDAKGNLIEMTVKGNDGSILNKETYEYQFDEFGNWKKMTASVAVSENGSIGYEPFEITYRTITYYYSQPAPAANTVATATPVSIKNPTLSDRPVATPTKSPTNDAATGAAPAKVTTDVKKSSDSEASITTKPAKNEPPVASPPAVTHNDDAPKLPVIRMSEEALRKAAIDLPQPQYPQAAMLARAEGNVEVQILVDEKGEVMNARALSGNPLLSEVSEAAARKARFARSKLSADPARIYGVINYSFTLPRDQSATPPANSIVSKSKPSELKEGLSDVRILGPGDTTPIPPAPTQSSPEPSLYLKGLTFLTTGNNAEAVETLKQATQRDPNDAAAYAKLGLAYAALRQYKEAVIVLKMAIRIKPEIVGVEEYYQLSIAYSALEKYSQALEAIKLAQYIKRAEQINPGSGSVSGAPSMADLHYSTGLTLYNLRRYRDAMNELKQVIELNPKHAQAYFGLALTYLAVGDRRSAEKLHETLEALDPGYAAKIAKILSTKSDTPQGLVFIFKTTP